MADPRDNTISYIEIPVQDIEATKAFFSALFGWQFQDFGPEYTCPHDTGLNAGFYLAGHQGFNATSAPLVVFYRSDLEQCLQRVTELGARISKAIFSFPGGRRFQFIDANNNEYAVWTDREPSS